MVAYWQTSIEMVIIPDNLIISDMTNRMNLDGIAVLKRERV